MNAFQDALSISAQETGPRLNLASDLLLKRKEWVLLENVAFCPADNHISCEVITQYNSPTPDHHLFQRELELAREMYSASTLSAVLHDQVLRWSVVLDYGMGRSYVWHAG